MNKICLWKEYTLYTNQLMQHIPTYVGLKIENLHKNLIRTTHKQIMSKPHLQANDLNSKACAHKL